MANDRELNRWCSLKKTMQHRPEHVEKYDQIAYSRKAENIALKRKILPSLFKDEDNKDNENSTDVNPSKASLDNCDGNKSAATTTKGFQNNKHENYESTAEHENGLSTKKKKKKKKNIEKREENINDKSELTNLINTDHNQPSTKEFQNNKHEHCESNAEHKNELSTKKKNKKKKNKKKKNTERREENINDKSELTNLINTVDNQPSMKGLQHNKHENSESNAEHENELSTKSKKKKKKHTERKDENISGTEAIGKVDNHENELLTSNKKKNKRHREQIDENITQNEADIQSESSKNIPEIENVNGNSNHNTNKKKKKRKKKKSSLEATNSTSTKDEMNNHSAQQIRQEKVNRKRKHSEVHSNDNDSQKNPNKIPKLNKNKKKHKSDSVQIGLSDARLASFGINPKKYKNKLKYKK